MEDSHSVIGKPGPFQIVEALGSGEVDLPIDPPRRRFDCSNYDTCLELAAALNWDNFTCRGCNAEISQPLLWRAHQAKRKDSVAGSICEHLPEIGVHTAHGLAVEVTADMAPPEEILAVIPDAIDLKA